MPKMWTSLFKSSCYCDRDRSWSIVRFQESAIKCHLWITFGSVWRSTTTISDRDRKSVIRPKTTTAIVIETAIDKPCLVVLNFTRLMIVGPPANFQLKAKILIPRSPIISNFKTGKYPSTNGNEAINLKKFRLSCYQRAFLFRQESDL